MKRASARGFTLIELLVVIAIIAILAAILFPVFAKARDKAKQSSCLSNMQQLSRAFLQYFQDNDEKFPPVGGWYGWGAKDTPTESKTGWSERVYPYVKNFDVYQCPSNNVSNFGYSMNYQSSNRRMVDGGGFVGIGSISLVRNPVKFIHLMESPGGGNRTNKMDPASGKYYDPARFGDADLSNDGQPDGFVYSTKWGAVGYELSDEPHKDARPIAKIRDDILNGASDQRIGHLHFPGWHNGGNNLMFLDGHVSFHHAWDGSRMTFYPNVR